ncbi:hypothetical protein AMQ84_03925 [Paenibacillus riograndensis]|uniref:ABC transporter permease n=1 Tax=Paenibacillus riograndensis TaxID=483937 RepID=A0A132U9S8_9BACL|nr:ABC transporter permease [Paenibacillus riograndensis]KWX80399.1 hypothetical protein AMQ84_03925 [Paenibacillus riograndensis]
MRNFLQAEIYFLRKDAAFKSITVLFALASLGLAVFLGSKGGYALDSPAQPMRIASSFSLFLYLVIPMFACFFITEGFEHGSVQNIIASGLSRAGYFLGKYLLGMLVILWWLLEFYGGFLIVSLSAALITGSPVGHETTIEDLTASMRVFGLNLLYLAAYSAVVMMLGVMIRKAASAIVATFFFVFGNFLLTGYLQGTSSAFLRLLSDHALMTQIMKFSGMYVEHSKVILLSGTSDYVRAVLIPAIIIIVSLTAALLSLEKRDIHI